MQRAAAAVPRSSAEKVPEMPNTFTLLDNYIRTGMYSVAGWFAHIDAEIFRTILIAQGESLGIHGACAEIGVYHGKSFIALCLGLRTAEKAFCIDIFSDQHLNSRPLCIASTGWHRRGLWRLYGPRNAAWCAIHGSGSYRRQARRQIPHLGFSRCISRLLSRLRPATCGWRACDDCGARGEPVTGAKHFQVCFGLAERGPAVRANDP
jgi:hypothetical protein